MEIGKEWRCGVSVELSEVKRVFSLPQVVAALGYDESLIQRSTNCPFHDDSNPSFGIWEEGGKWSWKCHAGCGGGDEVEFIQIALGISQTEAIRKFKAMAGKGDAVPVLNPKQERINWEAAKAAFKPVHRNRLAEWRGLTPDFVDWLHESNLVGVVQGQLAFPVQHNPRTTPNGKADGAHCFSKDKGWRILGGKGSPWWIGDHADHVIIFESQWDAFAFMDKTNWATTSSAISSILITRGAQGARKCAGLIPAKSKVYLFPQNDPIKDDTSPALKWVDDLTEIHPRCHIASTPTEHKDVNDWVKAGATGHDLIDALETATIHENPNAPRLPGSMDWAELLAFDPTKDTDNMLGSRWLSKGGSCVWVGSSGLGKSVLTLQAAMTWAAGLPFFGIQPKGNYTSLIIQAENNFGDVAETVQGVHKGLTAECPEIDFQAVTDKVTIVRMVNKAGLEFFAALRNLLADYQPDMVWIDPLLCYLGGDSNSAEDVAYFTGQIDEIAQDTGTLFHLIHHTGKPKTSNDTKGFTTSDLMYAGLGSSVLTNWARAIMVLQGERGEEGTFRLTAAKRGKRAGMEHEHSTASEYIYLEHSDQGLCWLPSDYEPPEKKQAGRPSFRASMLRQWPNEGLTQNEAMNLFSQTHFNEIGREPTEGAVKQAIYYYTKEGSLTRKDGKIYKPMSVDRSGQGEGVESHE